jgi:hypothetical protein
MVRVLVCMCENRTMKPAEIVLRRGERQCRMMLGGLNIIMIHCNHICKCHNESPCSTNIC